MTARLLACVSLTIAVSSAGCRRSPATSLDAAAEQYVRLVLALGERDGDSLDSYYGPDAWQAEARARRLSPVEIRAAADSLIRSLHDNRFNNAESEVRRLFLVRQLRAVVTRIDILRGARLSFVEEMQALFGPAFAADAASASAQEALRRDKSAGPAFAADTASASAQGTLRRDKSARQAGEVYAELERLLPGRGALSARYAAFDRRFLIAPERLATVISRAIDGCRAAAHEHEWNPRACGRSGSASIFCE